MRFYPCPFSAPHRHQLKLRVYKLPSDTEYRQATDGMLPEGQPRMLAGSENHGGPWVDHSCSSMQGWQCQDQTRFLSENGSSSQALMSLIACSFPMIFTPGEPRQGNRSTLREVSGHMGSMSHPTCSRITFHRGRHCERVGRSACSASTMSLLGSSSVSMRSRSPQNCTLLRVVATCKAGLPGAICRSPWSQKRG